MGVRGTDGLKRLISTLGVVGTPAFRTGLSKNLAQEAQSQVTQGFAAQRDPYGRRWAASERAKMQGGQTLSDTARLRRSFTGTKALERVDSTGFTLSTNVRYAPIHQNGGTIYPKNGGYLKFKVGGRFVMARSVTIPQRMMLPEGQLGPIWEPAFRQAAMAYTKAKLMK